MNKKITIRRYLRFIAVLPLVCVLLLGQDQTEASEATAVEERKVAKFVKPGKDPQSYVDRYDRDPKYRAWFDKNYGEEWGSIQNAVGLDEVKVAKFVKPDKDPQSYVDRYNKGGTYKDWFDKNYGEKWGSIYKAVGLPEPVEEEVAGEEGTGEEGAGEEEMTEVAVAVTEGDEPFYDTNGNGVWDDAEWWEDDNDNDEIDEAEPFVDENEDGIWNDAEEYDDANDNDEYDDGEEYWDTNDNGLLDGPEEFTDLNENGTWDDAEVIYDLNGNGELDDAEDFEDTNENGVWDGGPAMEAEFVDLAEGSSALDGYSLNLYSGYPIIPTKSMEGKESSPVFGISIGTPIGFKLGPLFANVGIELLNYAFKSDGVTAIGGTAFLGGINTGLEYRGYSISGTATSGLFADGTGFIVGGNVVIPLSANIPVTVRGSARANIIEKPDTGFGKYTGWIGGGISLGYNF